MEEFIANFSYTDPGAKRPEVHLDYLRRAETFLLDHVPIAGRVVSGRMKREDRPLYPPRATREVVANALCHRDYTIPGGAVSVAMYDDHRPVAGSTGHTARRRLAAPA